MDAPRSFETLVAEQLAKLGEGGKTPSAVEFSPWHKAAAVLSSFDESLVPVGQAGSDDAFYALLLDATLVRDRQQGASRYVLNPAVRRAVLASLTLDAMREARKVNPGDADDSVQRLFDDCLERRCPDVASLPTEQVAAAFEVATWLHGVVEGVPAPATVRARLDVIELLAPFRKLVGTHFGGRADELGTLSDYVGVLPPTTAWSWATRTLREVRSFHEKPPLVIHGPGGMGKSTLIAKFILNHAELDAARRFPFVYLDFDRPELLAAEPLSILLEAVRQVGVQYPEIGSECETLRKKWQEEILKRRPSTRRPGSRAEVSAPEDVIADRTGFIRDFASLLDRHRLSDRPTLLVLDTFEEVQYRSQAFVRETWRFLNEMQQAMPRLRTVIAGRAPLDGFEVQSVHLMNLDRAAAAGFLQAHGVPGTTADALAGRLGGNPLTLRLAIELIQRLADERTIDFASAAGALEVEQNIDPAEVQRQLYTRILEHIHDRRVQKLAHPGLVLRRVTADAVLEVLSEPCGVTVTSLDDARALLAEMGREASLVTVVSTDELRHRPDLRRVMLRFLEQDEREKNRVPTIHDAASRFYAARYERTQSPGDRAEEIYHRLALGRIDAELESRWMAGVDRFLYSAVEELPAPARAWLGTHLRVELDKDARQSADLELWEQDAARRAREWLAIGDPGAALEVIHERDQRSLDSPLFLVQAQALEALGELVSARATLRTGVERAYASGNVLRRLELLNALVAVEVQLGSQTAAHHLSESRELADRLGDGVAHVRLDLSEIELSRLGAGDPALSPPSARVASPLIQMLREHLRGLTDDQLRLSPAVVQRAAAEIADLEPGIVSRVLRATGMPTAGPELLDRLGRALEQWDGELARSAGRASPLNAVAVAKTLEAGLSREELALLLERAGTLGPPDFDFRKRLESGASLEDVSRAREIIQDIAREGRLEPFVNLLQLVRPALAETARKSTGPIAAAADLELSSEGTLESLFLSGPPTIVTLSLCRIIDSFGLHPRVVEPLADVLRSRTTPARPSSATTGASAPRNTKDFHLTSPQRAVSVDALVNITMNVETLEKLVRFALNANLASIASPGPLRAMASSVLAWAESQGRLQHLLVAVSEASPFDTVLRQLVGELDLTTAVDRKAVEDLLSRPGSLPVDEWQRTLSRLEGHICFIDRGEGQGGTGLLIAPEAVLTAYSVVKDLADRLHADAPTVRFTYDARSGQSGRALDAVPFARDWNLASDETLQYAVIRLAGKPGLERRGGVGLPRGWVQLRERAERPQPGSAALVLDYDGDGRRRLSIDAKGLTSIEGSRARYSGLRNAVSMGAPVFNAAWSPVAICEVSQRRAFSSVQQATLVSDIVEHLDATGKGWGGDSTASRA